MCSACHRTFNAFTGAPLAQLHKRDGWLAYARALVDRISLRKAAKRASIVTGIVEADETFILKSEKGPGGRSTVAECVTPVERGAFKVLRKGRLPSCTFGGGGRTQTRASLASPR